MDQAQLLLELHGTQMSGYGQTDGREELWPTIIIYIRSLIASLRVRTAAIKIMYFIHSALSTLWSWWNLAQPWGGSFQSLPWRRLQVEALPWQLPFHQSIFASWVMRVASSKQNMTCWKPFHYLSFKTKQKTVKVDVVMN